ncbi:uncharacterized protein LOC144453611 [Glandiceps talaboti]
MAAHDWNRTKKVPDEDDDEEDPVETMLKRTGCIEYHYAVQECMSETRDWRKCQKEVTEFRQCIQKQHQQAETQSKKS